MNVYIYRWFLIPDIFFQETTLAHADDIDYL